MSNSTLHYYSEHAAEFMADTFMADMSEPRGRFLKYLNPGDSILDFGCGTGRDTKAFLAQNFMVTATDGSAVMCRCAAEFTGQPVQLLLFQQLNERNVYDGIWACASVLHLSRPELSDAFSLMVSAVKTGGIIYVSFKYGTSEGLRGERYYTDFDVSSFAAFLQAWPELSVLEEWVSDDVRPGREKEKWLNVILRCHKE